MPEHVIRNGREQFEGMDLLRSIASVMIVVFHAHSIATGNIQDPSKSFIHAPLWWYSCIELFFVMSGFLMVHMSYSLYGRRGGVKEFVLRRLVRTPPLYYVFTTLIFLVFLLMPSLRDGPVDLQRYISSIFFFPSAHPPIIAIGWTLNYEVFFYVITALSILFCYPVGPVIAASLLILLSAIGIVFEGLPAPFSLWTDPLLFNFCAGIGVALLYYRNVSIPPRILSILAVVALVFLVVGSSIWNSIEDVPRLLVFTPAVSVCLMYFTLRSSAYKIPFGEKYIKSFALRTYTLYLCHIMVLKVVEKLFFAFFDSDASAYVYVVIGTIASIISAYVLYPLIEEPLGRALKSALTRRVPRRVPA